ncbi:MAG: hypothetical protein ACP6IS_12095 [Candidatus Asgardarchaeia archaeon]
MRKVLSILILSVLFLSAISATPVNAVKVYNHVDPNSGITHVKIVSVVTNNVTISPAPPGSFNFTSVSDLSSFSSVASAWNSNNTQFVEALGNAINVSIQQEYLNPFVFVSNFTMTLQVQTSYDNGVFLFKMTTVIEYDLNGTVSNSSGVLKINTKWRYITPGGSFKVSGITVNPVYHLGINLTFFDKPLEEWHKTEINGKTYFYYNASDYVKVENVDNPVFNITRVYSVDPSEQIAVEGTGYSANGDEITLGESSILGNLPPILQNPLVLAGVVIILIALAYVSYKMRQ